MTTKTADKPWPEPTHDAAGHALPCSCNAGADPFGTPGWRPARFEDLVDYVRAEIDAEENR